MISMKKQLEDDYPVRIFKITAYKIFSKCYTIELQIDRTGNNVE